MFWENVKDILKQKISDREFALWIEPLRCVQDTERCLELAGPDRFFSNWVSENYRSRITGCLADMGKGDVQVLFSVVGQLAAPCLPEVKREQLRLPSFPERRATVRTLHPRYTFDEFMVGESNAMAHAACETLARNGKDFNHCLYINAGTGLGKSHLTHAVGHHVTSNSPSLRLHYMTAQQLTAELVRHLRSNSMEQFKEKYHETCDFLMLEDVHALSGRNKTQEELAEAIDILMDRGKRIIFTGAHSPAEMDGMSTALRSRFSSGLVATINPPDFATRRRIVDRKAKNNDLVLTDEMVCYLAEKVRGDVRQIESVVVGLKAKSSILRHDPDFEMAKEILESIVGRASELTIEAIRGLVAAQFKVSVKDLQSKCRRKTITFPRQISMYLARKHTEESLSEIGKAFNRDHSTVVHSIRAINEAVLRNGSVRGQVELLSEKIQKRYS